eukprot:15351052-Alexandrium_andersonii.AAC.1
MTRSLADDSPERPLVDWRGRHLALDDTLERHGLRSGDVVQISISDLDDLCDVGPPPGLEPPRVTLAPGPVARKPRGGAFQTGQA